MEYEYKTEIFGCTFDTKNAIAEKLQRLLESYSANGWRLHTVQVPGASASFCYVIFEREKGK